MKQKQDFFQMLSSLSFVIVGNFLYALTVKLFLLPSGLVTGGTTGIALTIQHFFGVSVTQFVLAFNVLMLIAGYLILGRQFAATTLASTFLYPFALEIFDHVFGDYIITDDLLLCTIFSGLGIGIALGIVIRSGASTGGMDIPPLILHKAFRIPVSGSMYAFDVLILLGQALFRPAENILYGIVLVMIYTIVLDKLLLIGTTRTELKIVSQKSDEIRNAILEQIDRGVTLLDGESGYFHEKTQVLLSVISKRELPKVERLVHSIDPESFMVVSRVNEVSGRGFSMKKKYR
ncbi:YitT family protein [Dorea sp. YH-dor226]|uniref:YitT family protein n=1 Tax=Dorea sp. YH-dor226 TaxID=3151119 RepID=UPI003242070C